ncbi:MAG: hypothetical protein R3E96_16460 [Planctomycetota bacterium]
MQPTDKRSQAPGDSAEAVAARVRLLELGVDAELVAASLEWLAGLGGCTGEPARGCGGGDWYLARGLECGGEYEAFGVSLSSRCASGGEAAQDAAWLVANADHGLPFQAGRWMCCCR